MVIRELTTTATTTATASKADRSAGSNVRYEVAMDRLVWVAWRAFWIGLGAALVIVGQSVLAAPSGAASADAAPAPALEETAPARVRPFVSQKGAARFERVRSAVRAPHAS